jgi:hypothetical protein
MPTMKLDATMASEMLNFVETSRCIDTIVQKKCYCMYKQKEKYENCICTDLEIIRE